MIQVLQDTEVLLEEDYCFSC